MASRVYLFDLDAPAGEKELKSHPFNGAAWSASGPMAKDAAGEYIPDTIADVVGYSPRTCEAIRAGDLEGDADYMLGEAFGFPKGCARLTAASFPGQRIGVKVWVGGETFEFRTLTADEDA